MTGRVWERFKIVVSSHSDLDLGTEDKVTFTYVRKCVTKWALIARELIIYFLQGNTASKQLAIENLRDLSPGSSHNLENEAKRKKEKICQTS